jgi:hypothetical protein
MDCGITARHGKTLQVRDTRDRASVHQQKLTPQTAAILAVACAIETGDERRLLGIEAASMLGKQGCGMGLMVLHLHKRQPMLVGECPRPVCRE